MDVEVILGTIKKGFHIVNDFDIWDAALKTFQYNHKRAESKIFLVFPPFLFSAYKYVVLN